MARWLLHAAGNAYGANSAFPAAGALLTFFTVVVTISVLAIVMFNCGQYKKIAIF